MDENEEIVLIDVREKWENDIARIKDSQLIPLNKLNEEHTRLNPNDKTILYCHTGSRSFYAAAYLVQQGFTDVYNLEGGIDAWSKEVDPSVPVY